MKGLKQKFSAFRKSWKALRQANVDARQIPGMFREFRLWLRITANLREIEGSWAGAFRRYFWIFTGVPRKYRERVPRFPEDTPYDHYVAVNGIHYHYLEYPGEKETVFLLHGFGSSTYTWEGIIPRLHQAGYHIYALDMKGFGWSDKPRGVAYDPFTLMEEVNAWLEQMGLQKVVFVGNSLGGAIAVLTALEHPDKVGRMVLVDAGGYPMKKPLIVRLAAVPLAPTLIKMIYGPWVVRWNLREVFYDPKKLTAEQLAAYYMRLRTDGALEAQTALARSLDFDKFMPYIARIPTLETETLILWGRDDAWIPLRLGKQFRADLQNARLHVIPECGHIPQEECPDETARVLLDFLENRPPGD